MDLQKLREQAIIDVREKLKAAVTEDWLVLQASTGLDELDKAINLLVKRLREWYELYNPEFSHATEDHFRFVTLILTRKKEDLLREIKVKDTMGADLPKSDLDAIFNLAKHIKLLYELSKEQEAYLESMMKKVAPNIAATAGVLIGAKLISLAGSLERLSKFPASTIQILGAEKALFRHLRNKNNLPPKYGILHESALVSKVRPINKGKMARALGDKISIAAKVDFFKGKFIGNKLTEQLDKRCKELSK
ncbi:TPA: NOP58 family protein [Candidatus Woesearchaeota archaeon]|nr:NOP58 family protein [Candidatus Woesearchaeota archaeon]HIH39935.1 NOP58 family protein [Candidatus Woesearchaeota archaeon]